MTSYDSLNFPSNSCCQLQLVFVHVMLNGIFFEITNMWLGTTRIVVFPEQRPKRIKMISFRLYNKKSHGENSIVLEEKQKHMKMFSSWKLSTQLNILWRLMIIEQNCSFPLSTLSIKRRRRIFCFCFSLTFPIFFCCDALLTWI